tara:strand:+ start:662 stop:7474 length:6813 start_codon:yes stop_codon:yes gene_type:complete
MQFNVEAARAAGLSEEEIQAAIAAGPPPELTEEITTEEVVVTPEPPQAPPKTELTFDVERAKAAGLTDIQIQEAIDAGPPQAPPKTELTFNVEAARAAGLSEEEIQEAIAAGPPDQQPVEESSKFDRYFLDNAISLTQGVVGLGQAVVGLANIPTLGGAGKGLQYVLDTTFGGNLEDLNGWLQSFKTAEQLAAENRLAEVKGFFPTIGELATNPAALADTILKTLPQMAGGWGIARKGLSILGNQAKKKLGDVAAKKLVKKYGLAAAAAGEGIIASGAMAEQFRQESEDGLITPQQSALSVGSGVLTSIFGVVGGKAANKLGLTDIDQLMVSGNTVATKEAKNSLLVAIKAGVAESTFEEMPQSAQEQMVTNYANGRPILEGVQEAMAMGAVAGFAMAGTISGVNQRMQNVSVEDAKAQKEQDEYEKSQKEGKDNPAIKKVKDDDFKDIENITKSEEAEVEKKAQAKIDRKNKKIVKAEIAQAQSDGIITEQVLKSWGIRPNSNPWKNLLNQTIGTLEGNNKLNEELSKYKGKVNEKEVSNFLRGVSNEQAVNSTDGIPNTEGDRASDGIPNESNDANAPGNQESDGSGARIRPTDTGKPVRRKSKKQLALEERKKQEKIASANVKRAIKSNSNLNDPAVRDLEEGNYDSEEEGIIQQFKGDGDIDYSIADIFSEKSRKTKLDKWAANSQIRYKEGQLDNKGFPTEPGELIMFYHSTSEFNDFNEFKPGKAGAIYASPSVEESQRIGFDYASEQTGSSSQRSPTPNEGSRVYPVYIRAENVWDYDNVEDIELVSGEISKRQGKDAANKFRKGVRESDFRAIEQQKNVIEEMGYDGFFVMEPPTSGNVAKNIGVFNSNQLKSAIGNNGNYSRSNNNIDESLTPQDIDALRDAEKIKLGTPPFNPQNFNAAMDYMMTWAQSSAMSRMFTSPLSFFRTGSKQAPTVSSKVAVQEAKDRLIRTKTFELILDLTTRKWENIKRQVAFNENVLESTNGLWNEEAARALDVVLDQLNNAEQEGITAESGISDAFPNIIIPMMALENAMGIVSALESTPAVVAPQQFSGLRSDTISIVPQLENFISANGSLNLVEAMDIALSSPNADLNLAQKTILKILKKVPGLSDIQVQLSTNADISQSGTGGAGGFRTYAKLAPNSPLVGGSYSETQRVVSLAPLMFNSDQKLSLSSTDVMIHEIVHAATVATLATNFKDARKSLDKLEPTTKLGRDLLAIAQKAQFESVGAGFSDTLYGFTNMNEFLAEAFSNPQFQNMLASIEGVPNLTREISNDSLWGNFVNFVYEAISKLSPIGTQYPRNLFNDLVAVSPALFKGPGKGQGKFFSTPDFKLTDFKAEGNKLLAKSGQAPAGNPPPPKKPKYQEIGDDPRYDSFLGRAGGAIRWLQTKVFSFDKALNSAIIKSMRKQGVTAKEFLKSFYMLDSGQAVRADDVGNNFIDKGSIRWDKETSKAIVEESGMSMRDFEAKLLELSKNKNVPLEDLIAQAHAYFVSKRNQGMRTNNLKVRKKVLSLLRQGKRTAAKKIHAVGFKAPNMTLQEQKEGLKIINLYPELAEMGNMWNSVRENVLNFAVESGLYTQEAAEALLEVMDYVPFYRALENQPVGPQSNTRGLLDAQSDKSYKGSYRPVHNVFDNMEKWASYIVTKSVQNQAAVNKVILTQRYMGNEISETNKDNKNSGTKITLWMDGEKKSFQYKSKIFSEAFTGLEPAAIPMLRFFAPIINTLRLNIVLNPIFGIIQIPLDAYGTFLTSGVKFPILLPLQVVKEIALTPFGASTARKSLKKATVAGIRDYSKGSEQVQREMRKNGYNKDNTYVATLKKIMKPLQTFAMFTDNVIRQAVYAQTMLETNDARLATMRGAEIINFRRSGSSQVVNIAKQLMPFVNANLQALNVVGGTLLLDGISPQTKTQALATTLNALTQTVPLVLMYSFLMSDDEEYKRMDPAYRDNTLVMPGGYNIPLRPDMWTLISKVIPEHLFQRYIMDSEDPEKMKLAFKRGFLKAVALPGPMPTGVGPVIENMLNYDFYRDRPIVGRGLEKFSETPEYQYTPNTSQLSIAIASEATELFGYTVSPMKIDHAMRGMLGYSAGLIQLFSEQAMADINNIVLPYNTGIEGLIAGDPEALRRFPGAARLFSSEEDSRSVADFYELRGEINTLYTTWKALEKDKSVPRKKVDKFRAENQVMIDAYTRIKVINTQMNEIRKKQNELARMGPNDITPKEKRRRLDALKIEREDRLNYLVKKTGVEDAPIRRLIDAYRRDVYEEDGL